MASGAHVAEAVPLTKTDPLLIETLVAPDTVPDSVVAWPGAIAAGEAMKLEIKGSGTLTITGTWRVMVLPTLLVAVTV